PSSYIYTLSLHDALPISERTHMFWFFMRTTKRKPCRKPPLNIESLEQRDTPSLSTLVSVSGQANICAAGLTAPVAPPHPNNPNRDRKSTRLNSSHVAISY